MSVLAVLPRQCRSDTRVGCGTKLGEEKEKESRDFFHTLLHPGAPFLDLDRNRFLAEFLLHSDSARFDSGPIASSCLVFRVFR